MNDVADIFGGTFTLDPMNDGRLYFTYTDPNEEAESGSDFASGIFEREEFLETVLAAFPELVRA